MDTVIGNVLQKNKNDKKHGSGRWYHYLALSIQDGKII